MSPSHFHAKKDITSTTNHNISGLLPPPLKIHKESHFIKKSPSLSSSSSSTSLVNSAMTQTMPASLYKQPQQQQRHHPVIIYTHSPKVIHTQPKDFMTLVQKLTGLSRSESEEEEEEEDGGNPPLQQFSRQEHGDGVVAMVGDKESDRKNVIIVKNEDNETSSVITEENNCSSIGENQVNSCFMAGEASMVEHRLNPYVTNLPMFSGEFVCSSQPLLNYSDSLFFSHNMRTSIPSPTTLEGMKEFHEH